MRKAALLAAVLALTASAAGAEPTHQRLVGAEPAVGGRPLTSPRVLAIVFREPVIIASVTIALRDPGGGFVAVGPPVLDPANDHRVTVAVIGSMLPGTYRVTWRAVGADTHEVQGAYTFTVG